MRIQYDKHALLEFLERMQSMPSDLKSQQDESLSHFNECKQVYMRLLGEIDQICRKAYNRVENAESEQRSIEAKIQTQQRILESAESDQEKASAKTNIRLANKQLTDARNEVESANAEYSKAEGMQRRINALWEKYLPLLESASRQTEDQFFEFHTEIKKESQALSKYMVAMQQVEETLNSGGNYTEGSWHGGEDDDSSKENEGASEKATANTSKSSVSGFKTNKGNIIGLQTTAGSTCIVMYLGEEEHSFPNTKSGAAKAYRVALKSGDDELASQAYLHFTSFDSKSDITSGQQYIAETLDELQERLPGTIDKNMVQAGAEIRKMRTPKTETSAGELKGRWQGSIFFMDDSFVPKYKNDEHLTVAEIKKRLRETYGIHVEGIPFTDGVADFSSISVATISTKDIVMRSIGMSELEYGSMTPVERTQILGEVFADNKRESNFDLADHIIAERQISIPGLAPGYTADDLASWRKGKFTWDEQVNGGYNLVPTIIHGNISHTGLVSSSSKAVEYFEKRKKDSPEKYSWDEAEASISITEFLEKNATSE